MHKRVSNKSLRQYIIVQARWVSQQRHRAYYRWILGILHA